MATFTCEEWGGPDTPIGHPTAGAKLLVIAHHSYRPNRECGVSLAREAADVMGMHLYHEQQQWGGIGYNFLIFQSGNVYCGRGWGRVGAHTAGRNSSSVGICFVIDGSAQVPTQAAMESFWLLIAEGIRLGHIAKNHRRAPHDEFKNKICPGPLVKSVTGLLGGALVPVEREDAVKPMPTLRKGDGGKTDFADIFEAVRELQRRLDMPSNLRTGYFGDLTEKAVIGFQRSNGLLDDGIVGSKTWGALGVT